MQKNIIYKMKHIKQFESFHYSDGIEEYRYLNLEQLDNGDLKISLTDEGRELIDDFGGISEDNFDDFFEDIRGNSEWLYVSDMSDFDLGMTNAPCILDGYYFNRHGKLTDKKHKDSELYWYSNYMVSDFTEVLKDNGFVIFETNKPKTVKEIEDIKLKRDMKKFNI